MKKKSNLSRLLEIAGNHKYLIYASWILACISALLALVPYGYIWLIMRDVLNAYPDFSQAHDLIHYGWLAVLSAVIAVLVYIAALMCSHCGAFRVATNLRIKTLNHLVLLPLGACDDFGSGKLRKIVNESSGSTETYLAHQLPDRAVAVTTPCGLLVLLLVFDWRLGLLSLIPVALGFLIMMAMTGKSMQEKMKEYQNALDDMSNEAVEYVRGIPIVKTFGQTIYSFKKFKNSIDRYQKWVIAYTKQLRTPMIFYTAAINGVFVFLIVGTLFMTQNGIPSQFLLNLIFYIIITPIISLTLTKIMFQSENAMIVDDALSRIDSILNLTPLTETAAPLHPNDSSVEMCNVTFSYDGQKDVIKNVSLMIPAYRKVAFVGPSGGGKTTLAHLISRFFDPQIGIVKIGNQDVKNIAKEELMNHISFVFQNSHLIKASIFENVRLGKNDATREEVMEALKNAQCMDIIEKLPNGIDTVIGTKGIYLSGGEQQRIAMARVMLKDAPIVILDEASAFADPDNEAKVLKAFSALAQNKTVIMIAHRLSTVADVDMIYVISDGKIAESGTSQQLLKQEDLYAKMWKNYQESVQWKVAKEGTQND